MVGITLNLLDTTNPKTIFYDNITEDLANKIGIRSFLIMTLGVVEESKESVAIIPFPDEKVVAFVYLFGLEKFPHKYVISYTVDNSKQLVLYRHIPILEQSTKQLISEIEKHKTPLHQIDKNVLKSFSDKIQIICKKILDVDETSGLFVPIGELSSSGPGAQQFVDQKDLISSLNDDEKLKIAIKMLGKNPEIAFKALLTEDPLIILMSKQSDKIIAEKLNWNLLIPQRKLTVAYWSDSPCDLIDHDLLFGDKKIKKICHGFVIVDIDSGKTSGGEKDTYLENFFNHLTSKKCSNPMSELRKEVNNLLYWSQEIIDLCTQEINKNIEGRIANIIEMHRNSPMGNRLKIVSELAAIYNPFINNRIVSYFLQKELGISRKNLDIDKIRSQL